MIKTNLYLIDSIFSEISQAQSTRLKPEILISSAGILSESADRMSE